MSDLQVIFGGGFVVAVYVFFVVLAVAWLIVPFAIIGMKSVLRDLLDEQRRTNRLLSELQGHRPDVPSSPERRASPGPDARIEPRL